MFVHQHSSHKRKPVPRPEPLLPVNLPDMSTLQVSSGAEPKSKSRPELDYPTPLATQYGDDL